MEFLPSLSIIGAFTIAGLVLALTPGPDMTYFIGRTLSAGRRAGLATLMGTATGCALHTIAAVAGVSALLAASPTAFWLLKIAGATYLLWLAFQAMMKGSTFRMEKPEAKEASLIGNYLAGIGINILNPKVVIFFITFLPQFVSASDPDAWKKMLFLGLYFVAFSTPLMAIMVLTADRMAKTLLENPRVSRAIDWTFGTIFAAFAVRILLTEGR